MLSNTNISPGSTVSTDEGQEVQEKEVLLDM
jgi:hypothetical protein